MAALAEVKETALEARLSAMGPVPAAGWSAGARAEALARLRAMGLPGARDEYWKYTRPETLVQAEAPAAAAMAAHAET